MADRWVLPQLFKVQLAIVDWNRERERRRYQGPVLDTGVDPQPVQLRWLLQPALGLPLRPFTVWRHRPVAGNLSAQELANLPEWEPIEVVGLPIDEAWAATGYSLDQQGPLDGPLPPREAARRRLLVGAPRLGWSPLTHDGASLPLWEPPDLDAYLEAVLTGRLLRGIRAMLTEQPDPLSHAAYRDHEAEPADLRRLKPRLAGTRADAAAAVDREARTFWLPLGLLSVSAGSDPLASLALGFGTAVPDSSHFPLYLVSVAHWLTIGNLALDFELADVVDTRSGSEPPEVPPGLTAAMLSRGRPTELDGPSAETVGVRWDRPLNPLASGQPSTVGYAASYAVGRFGPTGRPAEILLTRRPEAVHGWLPFAGGRPGENEAVQFTDHLVRTSNVGGRDVPTPLGAQCTYAVAAQDIFGRWSNAPAAGGMTSWQTVDYQGRHESPQIPAILGARLEPSGELTVDFSWDWSDRSPEFIELAGAWEDAPATRELTARLQFGGNAQPAPAGLDVAPLVMVRAVSGRSELRPAEGWGPAQDGGQAAGPGVRYYRLRATLPLSFGGLHERVLLVQARGQCHLHQGWIPGFNVSPFGPPARARVFDPTSPLPPPVPEAPQWASLPDVTGVSRAVLSWPGDTSLEGYVLYEASETALLAALGQAGPDTARPFTERLAVLRGVDPGTVHGVFRRVFRRLQEPLIPPVAPVTSFEVELPRGSAVMHVYAVTAMSRNRVESDFPNSSRQLIAVAAPRLAVPAAPRLEVTADAAAGPPVVRLRVAPGSGAAVARFELYRLIGDARPASVDAMGPPLPIPIAGGGEQTVTDTTLAPGWRRIWYRAVAWSADDALAGLVGARSAASAAVPVLLPPQAPPDVTGLRVNERGSTPAESLVSWASNAPVPVTPLGPHTVVLEARDAAGNLTIRLESRLEALPFFATRADLPTADPANRVIARVGVPEAPGFRSFAWVPRPAPDQAFSLTVKMIDPLGRIGRADAEVPVLPALPEPELGPVGITAPPPFLPPPRFVAVWEILSPIPPGALGEYTLSVVAHWPGNPTLPPVQRAGPLSAVPEVNPAGLTPAQIQALMHRVVRVPGTQQCFMFLRRAQPVEVSVVLADSLGRASAQTGTLP